MTYVSSFNYNIYAEAQQEAFAQLNSAGRRVPVVFSHFLFTYSNINNTRKGAHNQLSSSASDAARRFSHNSTKEVTNSHFSRGVYTPSFLKFEPTNSFSYNPLY